MNASPVIPTLDVGWHTGERVGQLVNPGSYAFGYLPEWLDHGADLSPLIVPFGDKVHRVRDDAFDQLPGFLADCLPDSWGRTLLSRDFASSGVSPNPMRMLAWVGKRGIGALSFTPEYEGRDSSGVWSKVQPVLLAREAQQVLRNAPPETFEHIRAAGTAGGAFPKATVALLPGGSMLCGGDVAALLGKHPGARLGILKLDVEDDPTRPSTDGRLEMAYMAMARAAGISTARCEVLVEEDAGRRRHHLFVERFDVLDGGSKRVHMLSLAGALESFRYQSNYQLLNATQRLTRDHTQVVEATRRMLFNVRSGNADDHAKNHAFVFDREADQWALSPAYDLTLNYSEMSVFNGLFPVSFGMSPRLHQLEEVATGFGLSQTEFLDLDGEVKSALGRWPEFAKDHEVTAADIKRAQFQHDHIGLALDSESDSRRRKQRRRRW